MDFINRNWRKIVLFACLSLLPITSLAVDVNGIPSGQTGIVNPIKAESIYALIQTILHGVLTIGIPIVALVIIYSGFLFVFARGNPEKLSKAKDALLYTVIGAAILLGSWAIAQMIQATITGLS